MNRLSSLKSRLWISIGLAVAVTALYAASIAVVTAQDTNSVGTAAGTKTKDAQTTDVKKADPKPADAKATDAKPDKKPAKKKLTGAELYQINCNRCHPELYATEFNSTQWKTLITHMRVRANLPAAQAKEILKYLQEDAGN